MLTKAELKTIIGDNLADDRIYAIQLFITSLISRGTYGGGIEQYRIWDEETEAWITDLDNFATLIDESVLKARYHYSAEIMGGDRVHPFIVTIGNYTVKLDPNSSEDSIFFEKYGPKPGNAKLFFTMSYISDGDTELPIKIIDVSIK